MGRQLFINILCPFLKNIDVSHKKARRWSNIYKVRENVWSFSASSFFLNDQSYKL